MLILTPPESKYETSAELENAIRERRRFARGLRKEACLKRKADGAEQTRLAAAFAGLLTRCSSMHGNRL